MRVTEECFKFEASKFNADVISHESFAQVEKIVIFENVVPPSSHEENMVNTEASRNYCYDPFSDDGLGSLLYEI